MAAIEIDDNDKQFLPHLGKGTDIITNFDDWRKATHSHVGKTTRKVQEDYSNVEPRTHGEEILSKQEDHTRDKSLSVSAKVKASAPAAVGIPAGGSVKAGGSQSRTLSSMQSEHSVIIRTLAFKDETPSFPTDIEKDMCKYVVEWLKMHQSSATSSLGSSSSVKIEAVCVEDNDSVKRFNRYIDQLNAGEWDDLSDAITSYLATTKVTHYVCSITLGAKQYETVESIQASTEIVGGVGVDAANVAGAGTKGKLSSGLENKSRQTIKLGGHREFPESKDENVAIVKVGISPISELVEDPRVKAILDRAVKHYHEQKQRRKDKADSGLIGPVHISCDHGMRKVYWCVDDETKVLPTIKGTSDEENGSEFYLEDKGKGKFYIYFYKGDEKKESSKRRLAVKRSELPNAHIIVAVAKCDYNNRHNLKFETKNRYSDGIITVNDWLRKENSVYLRVRSAERFRAKKFYIKMNPIQSTEYDISFVSEDSGHFSDQTLFFICEDADTSSSFTSRGELLGTGNTLSSTSTNEGADSSVIADSDPLSPLSQNDSSPTYLKEITNDPTFDTLVSEDYVSPDLDMFEDECIQN